MERSIVQGTVATFDGETGSGTLLRDNGSELSFDGPAFRAGGMRHLRPGQRVAVAIVDGHVTAVIIATFPLPEAPD